MGQELVVSQSEFEAVCRHIVDAGIVAFDTEFVSEYTFRPDLCLLQFATPEQCVAVDPFEIHDLSPWWDIMLSPDVRVVVHGGREEVRFCLTQTGQRPTNIVDVQIAEGFRSRSFPLGYEALVRRVLGVSAHGRETRSDWRRRPLSSRQVTYALDDVRHVLEIWTTQSHSLEELGRITWVDAEVERMIDDIQSERGPDSWLRLSGLHKLNRRELAIARALYFWREEEADRRNRPIRRILRDDVIIELSRRHPENEADLLAGRDMQRSELRQAAPELLARIIAARSLPDNELPSSVRSSSNDRGHDEQILGQLLGLALANRCAQMNVSMSLVAKSADLRELVRWHVYGERPETSPRVTQGWRSEVCGNLLTDVLDGKVAFRVADPQSDHPLVFERDGCDH